MEKQRPNPRVIMKANLTGLGKQARWKMSLND